MGEETYDVTGAGSTDGKLLKPSSGVHCVQVIDVDSYTSDNRNDRLLIRTVVVNDAENGGLNIPLNIALPNANMASWLLKICRDELATLVNVLGMNPKGVTKSKLRAALTADDVVLYVAFSRGDVVGGRDATILCTRAVYEAYRKNPGMVQLPRVKPAKKDGAATRAGGADNDVPF